MSPLETDLYPDDDFEDNGAGELPDGFFPDDADEDDINYALDIRRVTGRPVDDLIKSFEKLNLEGRANQLRAVRFGSGFEALTWLFKRGIFLFSSLVQFSDGTWGVAIGSSQGEADDGGIEDDSIVF